MRVPEPTTGAGTEGVSAEQVRAQLGTGVPSAGGPVVVASQAASGGGVVMSPEQATALARDLKSDVVVLAPGRGRRGPRWMRFSANGGRPKPAADGLAVRPSKPDTSPTATRTDLGSLTHASTRAPETAKTPTPTPTGPETVTATADGSTGHTPTTMAVGAPGDLARPAGRESTADRRGAGASRKPVTARGHGRSVTLDEGRFPKDESALTVFAAGSARGRWIEGRLLSGEALDAALAARRGGGDRRPLRLVACDSAVGGWESDAGRAAVRSGLPVLGVRGWVWQAKRGGRYPEGMASAPVVDGSGRPVLPPNGGYVLFVPGKPEPYDLGSYVPVSLGEVVAAVDAGDMARLDELIANAEATAITAGAVGRMSTTGDTHAAEVYSGADTDWAHWADTDTSHTATGEQTLAQQRVVLGATLKRLRLAKYKKQGSVQGVSRNLASGIETGRAFPSAEELERLLDAYGAKREDRRKLLESRDGMEEALKRADLGSTLKMLRGLTAKIDVEKATGVFISTLRDIENDRIVPSWSQLDALLNYYNVPEAEKNSIKALRDAVGPDHVSPLRRRREAREVGALGTVMGGVHGSEDASSSGGDALRGGDAAGAMDLVSAQEGARLGDGGRDAVSEWSRARGVEWARLVAEWAALVDQLRGLFAVVPDGVVAAGMREGFEAWVASVESALWLGPVALEVLRGHVGLALRSLRALWSAAWGPAGGVSGVGVVPLVDSRRGGGFVGVALLSVGEGQVVADAVWRGAAGVFGPRSFVLVAHGSAGGFAGPGGMLDAADVARVMFDHQVGRFGRAAVVACAPGEAGLRGVWMALRESGFRGSVEGTERDHFVVFESGAITVERGSGAVWPANDGEVVTWDEHGPIVRRLPSPMTPPSGASVTLADEHTSAPLTSGSENRREPRRAWPDALDPREGGRSPRGELESEHSADAGGRRPAHGRPDTGTETPPGGRPSVQNAELLESSSRQGDAEIDIPENSVSDDGPLYPVPDERPAAAEASLDLSAPDTGPVTERTRQVRVLLPHNVVRAENVDGEGIRRDARKALERAGVPGKSIERVLHGLSDALLKEQENFTALNGEGLTVSVGRGAEAVEIIVHARIGDDTISGTVPETVAQKPPKPGKKGKKSKENKIENAKGGYGKVKHEASSPGRRDDGLSHRASIPVPLLSGAYVQTAINIKGLTPQSSWKVTESSELQHGTSVEPPGARTSSSHDLTHTATVLRTGQDPVQVSGQSAGAATVSTPNALHGLRRTNTAELDDASAQELENWLNNEPSASPGESSYLRGDRALFDGAKELVDRHPDWAGKADEIGSPLRNTLRAVVSGANLSKRGPEVLAGGRITNDLKIQDAAGKTRTATMELAVLQGELYALRTDSETPSGDAKFTTKSGRKDGRSLKATEKQPVGFGGRLRFTKNLYDDDANLLDLRLAGQFKRISKEEHEETLGEDLHTELVWEHQGELHGTAADLVYVLTIKFDDGRVWKTLLEVAAGLTKWRVRAPGTTDSVPAEAARLDAKPFPPQKVLGASETRFPNVDRVKEALREMLPTGVLQREGTTAEEHMADNETKLNTLVSDRGFGNHPASLNGPGLPMVFTRATYANTSRPDDFVGAVVQVVPRGTQPGESYGTFDSVPAEARGAGGNVPGAELKGELTTSRKVEHSSSIKTGLTAGGGGGFRGKVDALGPVGAADFNVQRADKYGTAESSLDTSSGVGRGQGWQSSNIGEHHAHVDYLITVFDNDGVFGQRIIEGGPATTFAGGALPIGDRSAGAGGAGPNATGRTSTGSRTTDGSSIGTRDSDADAAAASFREVEHDTPRRPEGWTPAALPDCYVVYGLDLPVVRGHELTTRLLGDFGNNNVIAAHQVHCFSSPEEIAANFDSVATGTYESVVYRFGKGWVMPLEERLGDIKQHTVLSNGRAIGLLQNVELNQISKVSGATGHGTSDFSGGGWSQRVRLGGQDILDIVRVLPMGSHANTPSASEGRSVSQEFEHTTTITYKGPVYLVAYDSSTLLTGSESEHGANPLFRKSWGTRHLEAHKKNSVLLLVPAAEAIRRALVPDAEAAPATGDGPTYEPTALVDSGHTSVTVRPEVTEHLLESIKELLSNVPQTDVPRTVTQQFADLLTELALGPAEKRASRDVFRQSVRDVAPRGMQALLSDLRGPGKQWSTTISGPLGTIDVTLNLKGRESRGRFDGVEAGWSEKHEIKTASARTVTTKSGQQRRFRPMVGVQEAGHDSQRTLLEQNSYARKLSTKVVETSSEENTRTYSFKSDFATFVHDLDLELTLIKTAHANRAPRTLTGGLADRAAPMSPQTEPHKMSLPGAVRRRVPIGELGRSEHQPGRIDALPDMSHATANSDEVHKALLKRFLLPPVERTAAIAPPVPLKATWTRHAIVIGTTTSALSAHLPKAMGESGYLLGGLDHDSHADDDTSHPLKSLVFHVYLEDAHVTPTGDSAGLTSKGSTTKSIKEKHEKDLELKTAVRTPVDDLEDPRLVTRTTGATFRQTPQATMGGPEYSRAQTSDVEVKFKAPKPEQKSRGETYLVSAMANWTITPSHRGDAPDGWNEPLHARDKVFVHTDEIGLLIMGLRPPHPAEAEP
ncbi:helix-turn-helix transcriptional regulator [Saccharopolyspora erythraea]|uniref:helix-turn-helix transcriptional regulator n=1 Tax=Saccharopolyspora erythraea TaxID=1836 RepID=UPI001267D6D9|nr:helix-turn-helix transcriptional regulator [Saccharopolyspora erythraea]